MRQLMAMVMTLAAAFAASPAFAEADPLPHVEARGSGDTTLVLIHGSQGDWRVWESFMERNADRYRMLAVRLPGTGGSEPLEIPEMDPLDETPWTDTVVDAIARDLRERGRENVYAVGHALGGVIAMRLAIDHPELVEGVVSVDMQPAYPLNMTGWRMSREERASAIGSNFLANADALDPIEWRLRWRQIAGRQATDEDDQAMLEDVSEGVEYPAWRRWTIEHFLPDLRDPLRESGVRVIAAAAMNEAMTQLLRTEIMVEEFWRLPYDDWPEADVTFFDESRHYVFLDRPEAFDAMIARFVAGEPQPDYSYGGPDAGESEGAAAPERAGATGS